MTVADHDWANMTTEQIETALDAAGDVAAAKVQVIYEEHAARHGTEMVWVERRAGYRGQRVCPRCYYGDEG